MNARLARLLKLHGLYCAPAGEFGDESGTGDAAADATGDGADADDGASDGADAATDEADAAEADPAAATEEDEVVVSLGDPVAPEGEEQGRAPDWLRDLRKANRDKDRRIRELENQVAAAAPAPAAIVVGEKPTLEGCDFDSEKFSADLEAWYSRKTAAEEQQRKRDDEGQRQRTQWSNRLEAVTKAAEGLKVRDHEDASAAFEAAFSMVQQGIVIGGPEDAKTSAMLRYALGKNPAKARELAAIQDPVKFAVALGKLEMQLKVAPRKSAPPPDQTVRSSVAGAAAVDSQVERLRTEARRTGDYSKVAEYNRQQAQKAATAK
jgi:hypothetical protein